MNIDLIAQMIERSPDRARIELDLTILFGEKDIRKIHHPNLDVFIEDVLPRLSPVTFRGGGADGRR